MPRDKENNRRWKKQYYQKHKQVLREQKKVIYQKTKHIYKDRWFRKQYGISLEQYEAMFVQQNGLCAICQKPERVMRSGNVLKLAIDHNHKTGQIRKLLCAHCNQALGKLHEDPNIMKNMISYIESFNVK